MLRTWTVLPATLALLFVSARTATAVTITGPSFPPDGGTVDFASPALGAHPQRVAEQVAQLDRPWEDTEYPVQAYHGEEVIMQKDHLASTHHR